MFLKDKISKLFWIAIVVTAISKNASAQYGVQQEIRLAKEAQESSERRIDHSKELIEQGLDEIRAEANKNIDVIFSATSECKLASSTKTKALNEIFNGIDSELSNYQASLERKKLALERISTILDGGVKRSCYPGSNEKIDSYLSCLHSREKSIHNATHLYGIAVLALIQKSFINEPFNAYRSCSIERNFLNQNTFRNVIESAIGVNARIEEYAETIKNSSNKILSLRN